MTTQLTLTGEERVLELTERQQFALEQIETADGGLASDELGALMHQRRGKHSDDFRCTWCHDEGASVAKELRRKKLVVYRRRTYRWESLRGASAPAPNTSAQTDEIPF